MAKKINQLDNVETENYTSQKTKVVVGIIAAMVVLTAVLSTIVFFASRGGSGQFVDFKDIEANLQSGANQAQSDSYSFVSRDPLLQVDGHNCFEATMRTDISAGCDWDDDGTIKPGDFDLAKVAELPVVETGERRVVRDDAGIFYSEVVVNDTAKCLGVFMIGEDTPFRAHCKPGALKEQFIIPRAEKSNFMDQAQSLIEPIAQGGQ